MAWKDVGRNSGDGGLMLKVGDKPVRIRLLSGPGHLAEPSEPFWQHWPSGEAAKIIKQPILCCGQRQGCIFHDEPLKWRNSKQFAMNVMQYTAKEGGSYDRAVKVYSANQVFDLIAQQARLLGVGFDVIANYDFIIGKTGAGTKTQYTVSLCPTQVEPGGIDYESLPDIESSVAAFGNPKLIDYLKFESMIPMTPAEQMAWYDEKMTGTDEADGETTSAPATTHAAPPALTLAPPPIVSVAAPAPVAAPVAPPVLAAPVAPKLTVPKPITLPGAKVAPVATPPPPPAPVAATPPPPPAAPKKSAHALALEAAYALQDPWGSGLLKDSEHLAHIRDTDGFSVEHKEAAALILADRDGFKDDDLDESAAPDINALRTQVGEAIKSSPALKSVANMKKFFAYAAPDKKPAIQNLDPGELQSLLDVAAQGEDGIVSILALMTPAA